MNQLDTSIRASDSKLVLFAMLFSLIILLVTGTMFGWIIYVENLQAFPM